MNTKILIILIAACLTAPAAAQPAPFVISGWVNCTDGNPVNDPGMTVTNLNTTEVFMADVMTLWYDYANYPTPGAHEEDCCS